LEYEVDESTLSKLLSCMNNSSLLSQISYNKLEQNKIKNLLGFLFKSDLTFFTKMRNLLTKISFEFITNIKEKVNNLINIKSTNEPIFLEGSK
jgi:hypothetical protein